VAERLAADYDLPPDHLYGDVAEFIEWLLGNGLAQPATVATCATPVE
jgi:hypothetical protein